jgi:hypothetical protein
MNGYSINVCVVKMKNKATWVHTVVKCAANTYDQTRNKAASV